MACRILVPQPGTDPRSWQWKHWVLTTEPPGNSLMPLLFLLKHTAFPQNFVFSWVISNILLCILGNLSFLEPHSERKCKGGTYNNKKGNRRVLLQSVPMKKARIFLIHLPYPSLKSFLIPVIVVVLCLLYIAVPMTWVSCHAYFGVYAWFCPISYYLVISCCC